jgi:hypothetical protein
MNVGHLDDPKKDTRYSNPGASRVTRKQHFSLPAVGFTVNISLLHRYTCQLIMARLPAEICLCRKRRHFALKKATASRDGLRLFVEVQRQESVKNLLKRALHGYPDNG